jgi:anti-anti-sigma factor
MSLFANDALSGPARIVHLAGDVDMSNAKRHGDALCEIVDQCPDAVVVVNCAHLSFLESQGLAMMHRVHQRGTAHGTAVVWRGLDAHQRKVLHITGLDTELFLDGIKDAGTRMLEHSPAPEAPAN